MAETNRDRLDSAMMRRAIEIAERGWGRVSPNPMVGCVVVQDGQIVAEGWHAEYGHDHAEVDAIRKAGDRARGSTIYVTLEPCRHFGKTPPCTRAILDADISRVVIACLDPSEKGGGGAAILRDRGIEVQTGVEEEAARALIPAFLHQNATPAPARPWIETKLALSIDGKVADLHGDSAWITGSEARAEVHRLRAGHDAIAVGAGTALVDDPMLTVRDAPSPRRTPVRIIFDRRLRLPDASDLLSTVEVAPVWLIVGPDTSPERQNALADRGARIFAAADLADALLQIREAGISSMLVEGGAKMAASLLLGDSVDRLSLFFAPLFLGPHGLDPFAQVASHPIEQVDRWKTVRQKAFGPDTLICLER